MRDHERNISGYLESSIACMQSFNREIPILAEIARILVTARNRGNKIYILGNGGSSSTASHMACDLNKTAITKKTRRFQAISLTDNVPVITAWSNDLNYREVFVEQLKNFLRPKDVVIAISGSGRSANVIRAVRYAKRHGATTIGLTGFNGGTLKKLVDVCLVVDSQLMYRIEDFHLMVNHLLTYTLLKHASYSAS